MEVVVINDSLQQEVYRIAKAIRPSGNWKFTVVLLLWLATSLAWLWISAQKPAQILENVKVVRRLDDFNFRLSVRDPDSGRWNEFAATFCSDFKPTPEIVAGVTLTLLKYTEDRKRYCMEIGPANLGYILLRGEHNAPIITSFTGQTPASTPTSTRTTY